jgi:hypothetical protein
MDYAACASGIDPDWFFEGETGPSWDRANLSSAKALAAHLTCASCPVRIPCLTEALEEWTHEVVPDEPCTHSRVTGIWAATVTRDRDRVRGMPIDDAIEVFEAGMAGRLKARIKAFKSKKRKHGSEATERVNAMLEGIPLE